MSAPTVNELRAIAKAKTIKGYSKMKKAELLEALKGLKEEAPVPAPAEPAQKEAEVEAPVVKGKKASAWIDFCKAYAKENNCTYRHAVSNAGAAYRAAKGGEVESA